MIEDRPKKSWRELDRQKDKSSHRPGERVSPGESKRRERSTKTYRATLERLFDQGGFAKIAGEEPVLDAAGVAAERESRLKLLAAIRDADESDAATKAVDKFISKFGDLPDDIDVWAQAAWHRDTDLVRRALEQISTLLGSQTLHRARNLSGRLRYLEELAEDNDIRVAASALRRRIA